MPRTINDWRALLDASAPPVIAFVVALAVILAMRRLLFGVARKRLGHGFVSSLVDAFWVPSAVWSFCAALVIGLRYADLSVRVQELIERFIGAFVILSASFAASSLAVRVLARYGERERVPFAVAGLTRTLTQIVVISMGVLMLLNHLRIPITPLLTALGVGGLAVALALQDTLANLFAGIHILVETPISVGEFIKLSSGEEGTVTDIGWRTTRVLTPQNTVVVIPNTKITSSILTNFAGPDRPVSADVAVLVAHSADIEHVQRIAREEAATVEGLVPGSQPVVLFDPGLTPTHMQFKVIVQVARREQQGGVQSEIRRRIVQRLVREHVPLPPAERAFGLGVRA